MTIKHISYLELTPEQRRKGAADARKRITGMMSTPFLTGDQHLALQAQLKSIDQWEKGELPVHPPAGKSVNHKVGVGESVDLTAKVS
jgi:hypothetical protein